MAHSRIASICSLAVLTLTLGGCADIALNADQSANEKDAMTELSAALKTSADRASKARMELTKYQAIGAQADAAASSNSRTPVAATSLIDIDYVGPVENAVKIIGRTLAWETNITGKKRADRLVSLRHKGVDAIAVLRDIGVQCGDFCDVHAQIVEGGQSSITLNFRD